MKQNTKITLCGITVALSVVIMLGGYFPYLTYAIPALAGLLTMVLVIEIDYRWALLSYIASSLLVFITAEPESKLMYICFFGFYPIIKSLIEKINKQALEWILKLLVFNISIILIYFIFAGLFDVSFDDFGTLGIYGEIIFLVLCNIVFVVYDFAVSRIAVTYIYRLHPKVKKILKF